MNAEKRLASLGYSLPAMGKPGAVYTPARQVGNLLFVSGQTPQREGRMAYTGKLGEAGRDVAYGQDAARQCILNMLAVVKDAVGDLGRVVQVVKLFALVQSAEGFCQQHLVANGASELLVAVFGQEGCAARSAVGANQLPLDASVEIEGIFEIAPPA